MQQPNVAVYQGFQSTVKSHYMYNVPLIPKVVRFFFVNIDHVTYLRKLIITERQSFHQCNSCNMHYVFAKVSIVSRYSLCEVHLELW